MYLDADELKLLGRLLRTFFSLPYSTDLDGKDAEALMRLVKTRQVGSRGAKSYSISSRAILDTR
jgi:hypothetical protein